MVVSVTHTVSQEITRTGDAMAAALVPRHRTNASTVAAATNTAEDRSPEPGKRPLQRLLSLPSKMAEEFVGVAGKRLPDWFAGSDPLGPALGSGGGTANLLFQAWRHTDPGVPFRVWLRQSRKLIVHAGGQSRRLPAYAPTGKALIPIPVFHWSRGQRLDQTLLDLQVPGYERMLTKAARGTAAMVASGDVLLRLPQDLPTLPEVDVLLLGTKAPPEVAKDFGVLFCPRKQPETLAFLLQKPSPARIREFAEEYLALVDTGMWLLSERAIRVLLAHCGWDDSRQQFAGGCPQYYELYSQFGLALGQAPSLSDPAIAALSCRIVSLPHTRFFHFGTTSQLIESVAEIQNLDLDDGSMGPPGGPTRPDQIKQNARLEILLHPENNRNVWVENSSISAGWRLASNHVLTGVPENDWKLKLESGVCLDFDPIGQDEVCIRPYGFTDAFSGRLSDDSTLWLGHPAREWFSVRGLEWEECGLDPLIDIQHAALFPVVPASKLAPEFVQWLTARSPARQLALEQAWRALPRLSAFEIASQVNLGRLLRQRDALRRAALVPLLGDTRRGLMFQLDLEWTAEQFAATDQALPEFPRDGQDDRLLLVHEHMFRSAVLRHQGASDWPLSEAHAFAALREMIASEAQSTPVAPRRTVLEDQIVWGRSPVRFDLAGGWSDTPPYCLEHGGKVVNLAADLNGQPPIQVFAKLLERPELVLRSIDLGVEERVRSYEELDSFSRPEGPFALAKAALALAGFLPRFHSGGGFASLQQQLLDFGGGLELALVSAVPKGSGLGASSILAATVLATLAEACGLKWDRTVLFARTLVLEQMLTTGGGWQDQAGAIYRGVKMVQTEPGLCQRPALRWLPSHLFEREYANRLVLLYYTGLTRLAKNILAEIVREIFLNSPRCLSTVAEIATNADLAGTAIQTCDYSLLLTAIRHSWSLNQRLDSGTNPPGVQQILHQVEDYLGAAKLLGAGGGGYLLLFAKDENAGARIRQALLAAPPNPRARFVDFSLSETGLQVTRS